MVDFTFTNRVGNTPLGVNFTDSSVGTFTYRKWVFGDGESLDGNETAVSHIYKKPGVYSVSLIAGNATDQQQITKESLVYVNENIEDSRLVIAESKDRLGAYWKFYIDSQGKLVFETQNNTRVTDDVVVLVNRWMFLEYHVGEDRFYVGSYANGRRHKTHVVTANNSDLVQSISGFLKIATNSSFIIDDLKIWEEDRNLFEYFNSLRGRAGFLDPVN